MKEAIITDVDGVYIEPIIVPDEETGITPLYEQPEDPEAAPVLIGYRAAIPVPDRQIWKLKLNVEAEAWEEGETAEERAQREAQENEPTPQTPLEQHVSNIEERTLGMQEVDQFTMQAVITADERTIGMQEVDQHTLTWVADLQALVDTQAAEIAALRQEIETMKGGV